MHFKSLLDLLHSLLAHYFLASNRCISQDATKMIFNIRKIILNVIKFFFIVKKIEYMHR